MKKVRPNRVPQNRRDIARALANPPRSAVQNMQNSMLGALTAGKVTAYDGTAPMSYSVRIAGDTVVVTNIPSIAAAPIPVGAVVWMMRNGREYIIVGASSYLSPACWLYNSTGFTNGGAAGWTDGTQTLAELDTVAYDSWGMASVGNDRIVVRVEGLYVVTAQLTWVANITGQRLAIIQRNGSNQSYERYGASPQSTTAQQVVWSGRCNVNDYLQLAGTQSSGGTLLCGVGTATSLRVAFAGF